MIVAVITKFLKLKEKIVLSMLSKTHHSHVNKHGLNHVVYDLLTSGVYCNLTGCRDIDGLMIRVLVSGVPSNLKPLGS